ncbi:type IVB secretion system protein IcmJDotN [Candidiatus Paracoxiella cheracis]|uniref:type IVB secretion system protein IcmJDotN n=1 Tax=Candidiatus Paracoxiella cheracis TaxID=3405120 RepID=UPI003BF4F14E
MVLHDIKLSATDGNWRLFMVRKADPAFLTFQNKVFERDENTCQFCRFQAREHLDVVNLDGNYRNNRTSNLVTACSFCVQCFFLEAIGKSDFGGGTLIYLPEMTQGELNALCHILFSTMVNGSEQASQARNIYRSFKLRLQQIEKILGEGLSNPALYGRVLIDANVKELAALNAELMPKLRLLPDITRFTMQLKRWSQNALEELSYD